MISDVKQLKALGHATRVRILSTLVEKPMTAKQLADEFGEEPAKTSYHVKQLLKVGLVKLKFTRPTQNGIIEKYYQAIAKEFQTDPYLSQQPLGRSHLESTLIKELHRAQSDFLRAFRKELEQAGKGATHPTSANTYQGHHLLQVDAARLPLFLAELQELIGRYEAQDGEYAFHCLLYPTE